MRKNSFIFISHSATLTGAPLIVSALVDFIAVRRQWPIHFLFLDDKSGSSMRSLAHLRRPPSVAVISGLSRYILIVKLASTIFIRDHIRRLLAFVSRRPSPLSTSRNRHYIYANSIVSLKHACQIKSLTRGILILHLHELRFWIARTAQIFGDIKPYVECVDLIIAPSPRCIDALISLTNTIPSCKSIIIPEPCEVRAQSQQMDVLQEGSIRPASNLMVKTTSQGTTRKLCVCNGTDSWRKGLDHFLRVASVLNTLYPSDYHFVWVSLPLSSTELLQIESECDLLGIRNVVEFIEPIADFGMLLAQSDCYLLTSREDPMPVAALEAMTHDVPIVCFANTGGIPDLLSDSPMQVVPYCDINRFAKNVHSLMNEPSTRAHAIEYQRAAVRQCSPEIVFGSILDLLDGMVAS
jgi:glycosyltransferase involved in cell wall biosynthesis